MKQWRPTLGGIEIASALIAGLGIVAIADYVSLNLSSPSFNYLFIEMAMIGVATALVAYLHVHNNVRFGAPMLILLAVVWAITAALFAPPMMPVLPLALLAVLSCTTGLLREKRKNVS